MPAVNHTPQHIAVIVLMIRRLIMSTITAGKVADVVRTFFSVVVAFFDA